MTEQDQMRFLLLDQVPNGRVMYELLSAREGWTVEVRKAQEGELVEMQEGGLCHCPDGRVWAYAVEGDERRSVTEVEAAGPKVPGGVYGVAASIAKRRGVAADAGVFREACELIQGTGFVPELHGDVEHGVHGCGIGDLWSKGELSGWPELGIRLEEAVEIAKELGVYTDLDGIHGERDMWVVMRPGMTAVPNGERFVINGTGPDGLELDWVEMVETMAEAVELLGGERDAVILV